VSSLNTNLATNYRMKYRSRTDITGLILEAANGGTTKTKIMYKAYLSFAQLRDYLSMLIEKGLIEYEEGAARYRTTEKGLRMLQMCNKINDELAISPTQARGLF
jgi:predicted transcriptional regulator